MPDDERIIDKETLDLVSGTATLVGGFGER